MRRLDDLETRLGSSARLCHSQLTGKLEKLELALRSDDPRRQLERGFALVRDPADGSLVRSARQAPGTRLCVQFSDGEVPVSVLNSPDELF